MIRLVLLWLIISLSLTMADTIHFKTRKRPDVTVIKEDYQQIVYKMGERQIVQKINDVKWVEYSDAPQEFLDGRAALNNGETETAVELFKEAMEIAKLPPGVRDWINQYGNYYLALAYHKWADSDPSESQHYNNAIRHYRTTLKQKETRFLYASYFGLSKCYINLETPLYKKANNALNQLDTKATKNESQEWIYKAKYLAGDVFSAQKEYASALEKYKAAYDYAQEKDMKSEARTTALTVGRCYINKGDFNDAIGHYQALKNEAKRGDFELFAGVENGLAASYLAQGQVLKARRKAINVILKYYQADQQRAQAFYIAGQCYEKLKDKEQGSLKRAKIYYQFLRQGYPNSPWTPKAARRLQQLSK